MKPLLLVVLPHLNALLNLAIIAMLLAGRAAIREGNRARHRRRMLSSVSVGVLFIASYGLQVGLAGHQRFPGDDWVRTFFLLVLGSHTLLAIALPFLVVAAVYLALKGRFPTHRRVVRIAYPTWMYVSTTAVVIYVMNNFVRPV